MPVFHQKPKLVRQALQSLVDHALDGKLRVPAAQTLPLSETAQAHRLLEERKVNGVVVLDPRK
jgi:NADPH:quinone reductase